MKDSTKKSKILTAVVATALAASLLIGGGTFAYLQDETDDVVNNFETNQVLVDLDETTGSDYEIIPGTSQEKDPTVTVNTTIPAYVYVTVTDETDGLVGYEIADGWQQLLDGEGNPVENVYYREVEGSDAEQQFPVLEGNRVTYDASLVNEDMWDENGNLKVDVKLTFSASAIQKEPFNDPYDAYVQEQNLIMNEDELTQAIQENWAVKKIGQDFSVSRTNLYTVLPEDELTDIDLNGYTITIETQQNLTANQSLLFHDGGLDVDMPGGTGFLVQANGELTLENVESQTHVHTAFYINGSNATLNLTGCSVVSAEGDTSQNFLVATNSSNTESHYGVEINIKDSHLEAAYTDGWTVTAVMLNVPGTLTIENSTLIGERQAVCVRGGTAVIKDSTLSRPYAIEQQWEDYFVNGTWGQATSVPFATLFIGNHENNGSYQYPSDVTLINTQLTAANTLEGDPMRTVYIRGNDGEGLGATLTYDAASSVGTVVTGNEYVTVNAPA